MRIYRIENRDREGPYMGGLCPIAPGNLFYGSKWPGPRTDFPGHSYHGMAFGFSSLRALRNWFLSSPWDGEDPWSMFASRGYSIVYRDIPSRSVIVSVSRKQVMFGFEFLSLVKPRIVVSGR